MKKIILLLFILNFNLFGSAYIILTADSNRIKSVESSCKKDSSEQCVKFLEQKEKSDSLFKKMDSVDTFKSFNIVAVIMGFVFIVFVVLPMFKNFGFAFGFFTVIYLGSVGIYYKTTPEYKQYYLIDQNYQAEYKKTIELSKEF